MVNFWYDVDFEECSICYRAAFVLEHLHHLHIVVESDWYRFDGMDLNQCFQRLVRLIELIGRLDCKNLDEIALKEC